MVTILMATCNGEKYISEQIESILDQTYDKWKLIIQDDCSIDKTTEIVHKYIIKYPEKITFIQLKKPSGSAKGNFFSILKYADTQYTMTCDQDDYWLPDKIAVTLDKMHELEREFGNAIPILVHTDLRVIDEKLNTISDSLFTLQKLDNSKNQMNHLLVQNIVTGCTIMINQPLLAMLYEVPQQAIMHDWWFALVASAFGELGFISTPTILYRQHTNNEVGAKNAGSLSYILHQMLSSKKTESVLKKTYDQARNFLQLYGDRLNATQYELVREYSLLAHYNKIKRLRTIIKYDFWKTGFYRRCGQIIFM